MGFSDQNNVFDVVGFVLIGIYFDIIVSNEYNIEHYYNL